MTLFELEELMNLAAKHCVLKIAHEGTTLEFHADKYRLETQTSPQDPIRVSSTSGYDPNVCKCGHDLNWAHNDLGCLEGCPLETCSKKTEEDLINV